MRNDTRAAKAARRTRPTAACFTAALALLPCPSTVRADETFIVPLHACPGSESCSTWPRALSEHGVVAVGRVNYASAGFEAFRWVDGEFQMLGFLGTGTYSWALDVSADGSVVVGRSNFTDHTDPTGPFRWTAEAGMVHLLGPGGAPAEGTAYGVSADGTVVVGGSRNAQDDTEAFRWESGVMTGLGELPGGATYSSATAVSADRRRVDRGLPLGERRDDRARRPARRSLPELRRVRLGRRLGRRGRRTRCAGSAGVSLGERGDDGAPAAER
jgi:probable HAF family extracellular repeat protein